MKSVMCAGCSAAGVRRQDSRGGVDIARNAQGGVGLCSNITRAVEYVDLGRMRGLEMPLRVRVYSMYMGEGAYILF